MGGANRNDNTTNQIGNNKQKEKNKLQNRKTPLYNMRIRQTYKTHPHNMYSGDVHKHMVQKTVPHSATMQSTKARQLPRTKQQASKHKK